MPITRDQFLIPLSREHHHGLLLCWKIRTGTRKNVAIDRIQSYTHWFYQNYLLPHFEIEENYVFPVLGQDNELVKRAMKEHRKLRRLFEGVNEEQKNLALIEELLDAHIRFEERILFNEIQAVASPDELSRIMAKHSDQPELKSEVWKDEFWK